MLRTRRDTVAKLDDNAEEGVKSQDSGRALPAFRGCHRKLITGILLVLLVLYLTVPGSGRGTNRLPQQA